MGYSMGMGKSAGDARSRRGARLKASVERAALIVAAACAPLLSACDLPATFGDEYYDTSVNFITARALAAPSASADSAGSTELSTTGAWDWSWRGETGNSYAYMTLSDAGIAGAAVTDVDSGFSLAADEEAWRLTLVNLAANPFFEDGTYDGWESTGTATVSVIVSNASNRHGNFLKLVSPATIWAGFDPSYSGFILDGALGEYRLLFLAPQEQAKYLIEPQTGVSFSDPKTVLKIDDNKQALETFSIPDSDYRVMFAASSGSQTLEVDDLRIVRHDLKTLSSLRMYLAPADTSPGLVPGRYEFSIWARMPPGALAYSDSGRVSDPEADFAATKVTLAMRQVGFMDDVAAPYYFAETFDVGASWTRLALRMGDGNLTRFDESSVDPVLELVVYPFDTDDMDAGAVEISSPSLRFFVDGYTD